jgi:hypothetical protein
VTVTRLVGGLTPGDGSDPRTFPAIFNAAADVIDATEGSAVALGSAVSVLEGLNPVQFGTVVPSDGQVLAYSTAVAGYDPVDVVVGPGDNLLFNGAMQVHQRRTSVTGITAAGYYTADRWRTIFVSLGTWTQSIENDAPTGSGFTKSTKLLCTTADSTPAAADLAVFTQRLEGQDVQRIKKGTSDAEQLTLSFWVKSNVTGTYICDLFDSDNNRNVSASYNVIASGTWEKKIITFSADTTGAFDNDNENSLEARWWLGAGTDRTSGTLNTTWGSTVNANLAVGQTNLAAATNNYWQITGVQLEVGPVASPFEFKPYGVELAECQRYYYRTQATGDIRLGTGFNRNTTSSFVFVPFPTSMRVAPTGLEQSGTAGDYAVLHGVTATTCSAVPTHSIASTDSAVSQFTVASGLTTGQGSIGFTTTASPGFLAWSAEL